MHLVYGASTDDDVVKLDEVAELEAVLPSFTWEYVVSDPASTAPNQGYVMSLIRDEHLYGGDVAVYLCGPPPMVEAVRSHFADSGVEVTGFYYEKFALSGTAPAAVQPPVEAPVEPPVEAAVAMRVEVPGRCPPRCPPRSRWTTPAPPARDPARPRPR